MSSDHLVLASIEKAIRSLDTEIRRLAGDDQLSQLLKVIHRPGWTTMAEGILVLGMAEAGVSQARTLAQLKAALVHGAGLVGGGNSQVDEKPQNQPAQSVAASVRAL